MNESTTEPKADALDLVERAWVALGAACENGFRLQAHIPVRPESDHDVLIADGLKAARDEITRLRGQNTAHVALARASLSVRKLAAEIDDALALEGPVLAPPPDVPALPSLAVRLAQYGVIAAAKKQAKETQFHPVAGVTAPRHEIQALWDAIEQLERIEDAETPD